MGFKRFVAATTKDAMTQVRRELGDDAVILSNKRVANGHIEILAAASHAVEAIVEDARRPAARAAAPASASVQIAPGVRRIGVAVESFQDFLRRQRPASSAAPARTTAGTRPGTVGGASMYSAVAQATANDDSLDGLADDLADRSAADDGWANSRFDPTLMAPSRIATPSTRGPSTSGGTPSRTGSPRTAPAIDTWLPNEARATASAQRAAAAAPLAAARAVPDEPTATAGAPAVFRRRPSRESAPATINVPLDDVRLPVTAAPMPVAPEAGMPSVPMRAPSAMDMTATAAPLSSMPVTPPTIATPTSTPPAAAPVATAAPSILATATVTAGPEALPRTEIRLPSLPPESANAQLMAELASLRASLQQQLSTLSSTVAATDSMRRHPLQTRVMTRLLTAGFSVEVARRIALNAPELHHVDNAAEATDAWMQDVLTHNLRCAGPEESLVDRSGVFALVGPTGVGKTTTVAKIAARFAVRCGAGALGLITLDAYRVAAQEQLRTYGRILGTPVHLAQDVATLRELLASMKNKRLVLIDTCGLGPRDERLPEMLGILAQAGGAAQRIQPVLLLNAASHAETLDETARAWRAADAVGAMLTKIDEAARIGGALDCALRHKLKLLGLTNGQRVPEDLHQPNARLLAHLALKPANQMFELADDEGAALAVGTVSAQGMARA
jgi:flagellar biosynthesis protein FlhF